MRSFWPLFGAALTGSGIVAGILFGPASCSTGDQRIGLPPLGQHFTIMPAAINDDGPLKAAGIDYKAVRLNVMWGGRPIRSGATLRFYTARDGAPAWTMPWVDLAQAHKATDCSEDLVATMDDAVEGVALVCNGSLKMESFVAVDAIDDNGEVRSATSWSTYAIRDDVLGVAIQLY